MSAHDALPAIELLSNGQVLLGAALFWVLVGLALCGAALVGYVLIVRPLWRWWRRK